MAGRMKGWIRPGDAQGLIAQRKECSGNMTDKETHREENETPVPAAEGHKTPAHHGEDPHRRPEQALGRYMDLFKQSLASEGEPALQRWGLPMYHVLSDEEAEAQRQSLAIEPKDALDFYNRGCLLASREDYSGAVKAFERALALDPKLKEAAHNRSLALELSGDVLAARAAWRSYLETFTDSEDIEEVKQHLESLTPA
jgi:tetratricopeptide (TPR) repeat protein